MWLSHSFILLVLAALANGSITNTTVDDTSSSFTFAGAWSGITPTSPCNGCSSKPDPSLTYGGTWHDGNIGNGASPTTGSFTFQGSAVYIFGIDQAISQPDIAFTLGSVQSTHHYTGTEQFVYDALFFSATGLAADQTHTVNWVFNVDQASGVSVLQEALFDYAIVTSGEEDVQTTPAAPAGNPPTSSRTTTCPAENTSKTSTLSSGNNKDSESSGHTSVSPSGVTCSTPQDQSSSSPTTPYPSALSSTVTVDGVTTTVTAPSTVIQGAAKKSNVEPIIGAVLGALVLAVLAALFLFLCSRRARRLRPQTDKAARTQFLRIEDYPLQSVQSPPPHVDTREVLNPALPVSIPASITKSRQYLNDNADASTATLLRSPETPPASGRMPSDSSRDLEGTSPASATTTTSRDFRFLEDRLATLEAQVSVQQQPPPYVPNDT
ncbi:hypothetical protein B0H17DRAFT_1190755 [Mycena rosella]|uniref:Uncharacterized protein n=1 Tax=Mycena rosella TaxID=1033263 RepID=A0AAD7H148_MYCRO|nr:hypothetical protein B0H17DRAFT_1190755 [Mycena rosella]